MSSEELPKAYDHREVETRWYAHWKAQGYFHADAESKRPPYVIVIPPPNVTGSLHMGHALTVTIQDVLIRHKRMSGFEALWLPGTDHAGIATQMVVERELAREKVTRFDLGREKFLEKVWEWKDVYHARIAAQLEAMGCSLDWERERFTMDEGLSAAVREVFVRLYEEGLIYRADRLVNWSPGCQTVISDLEVLFEEKDGSLWEIAYPVVGQDLSLVVATTRPETMLGDTAVAVHPDDERYRHLIGCEVRLPLTGRLIPVIGDAELVDMAFGTGAVKVTPAHDFNDFEVGKRHNLPTIAVLDAFARVNENAPEAYRGLDRFEARKRIVADLDALGLLVGVKPHKLNLGHCQRSGSVVEPMLSKQWYVKMEPLARPAAEAVRAGKTQFVPESWEKTYFQWMDNIRDWCISRQLWWGHQIPAWHCGDCAFVTVTRTEPSSCGGCGGAKIHRDPDVLDTWFSSALWPFSTLGWPERTPDLQKFYPTTVMETGFDIIFFWVARMMMMGLHFTGEVPFKTVLLHAMVRDEHGHKMSKTKGNVIDPLDVSRDLGADSLRLTLAGFAGQGRDIKLSLKAVEGSRNFINKVWNASRFALMNLGDFDAEAPPPTTLGLVDRWLLSRLDAATAKVQNALDALSINEASTAAVHFFWYELCDWYVELSKPLLYGDAGAEPRRATQWTLLHCLDAALRLLHPFIPFATEEIWQKLPLGQGRAASLMIAEYPRPGDFLRDPDAERDVTLLIDVITAIRNVRGELKIPGGKALTAYVLTTDEASAAYLRAETPRVLKLSRVETLFVQVGGERPKGSAMQLAGSAEVHVPVADFIDIGAELTRLDREMSKAQAQLDGVKKKLDNPQFVERASEEIVEKERDRLADLEDELARLGASRLRIGEWVAAR
ncbi:MAG: valine--tRNA ligase [Myxococcales bacterium]|nr:valine--tRNA ligase [Myxococcales bacterium]